MKLKIFGEMKRFKLILFLAILFLNINFAFADANFQLSSFSCSPSSTIVNSLFSCTAQIENTGTAGTLNVVYLYSDANYWLENSVYTQAYGQSIATGEIISLTFTGLKAIKAGNSNGFSKIVLDNAERTDYVSTTKVKVIDVVVTVNNSVTSSAMSGSFISTATVTAGGNIDVILTFTVDSGGCSIGNEPSQKTITGMQNGNAQSRTWTVTQGTSGDCKFTISAAATGSGIKVDTTPSTITCTNCPVSSGSSSSSGGGGGGEGGASGKTYTLGELSGSQEKEIAKNDKIKFNISNLEHKLTLKNLTETTAVFTIESAKQTFSLIVRNEINVDVDGDGKSEISVFLKSINILTKKAKFILTRISGGTPSISGEAVQSAEEESAGESAGTEEKKGLETLKGTNWIFVLIGAIIIIAIIIGIVYFVRKRK
ncbi:hypothetical protein J4429_02375 [Candidatus Pacearchaeota archaeon]|nr:hypothetical protein [Candidatus Pacearchaeota archaeon]